MKIWVSLICLSLAFAAGCVNADGPHRSRPRAATSKRAGKQQALSPVGGYLVTASNPTAKKPERNIVITRSGDKREILRFPFQRQVDVIWAPDETAVAVVDLVLQNESRVVVFDLPSGRLLYELGREQLCELNRELPCGERYSHVFLSNVDWLAPDRIRVTVDMANPLERGLPAGVHGFVVATFPRQ